MSAPLASLRPGMRVCSSATSGWTMRLAASANASGSPVTCLATARRGRRAPSLTLSGKGLGDLGAPPRRPVRRGDARPRRRHRPACPAARTSSRSRILPMPIEPVRPTSIGRLLPPCKGLLRDARAAPASLAASHRRTLRTPAPPDASACPVRRRSYGRAPCARSRVASPADCRRYRTRQRRAVRDRAAMPTAGSRACRRWSC